MKKENIKEVLTRMKTKENEIRVNHILKALDQISEEELNIKLEKMNLSESNIEQYLSSLIEKPRNKEKPSEKFISVNDWFCYGRTGNTIHLHLIPEDLRGIKKELGDEEFYSLFQEQLEDFLSKIKDIFLEDISIKTLFAVSPIFYNLNIASIHENLGFDKIVEVDPNNENDNMSNEQKEYFLNMFNKGERTKRVYYTKMTREKLLGMKYQPIKEEISQMKH